MKVLLVVLFAVFAWSSVSNGRVVRVGRLLGNDKCQLTGPTCLKSDCMGMTVDGYYQYCGRCDAFLYCENEETKLIACPPGYIFNDMDKMCNETSITCNECYKDSHLADTTTLPTTSTTQSSTTTTISTTTTSTTSSTTSTATEPGTPQPLPLTREPIISAFCCIYLEIVGQINH